MFRDRIKKVYADLSPSFQRLADFLVDHPYEAAFMTATELGRQLDVDTATVVRFAQRLDYPGFPELLDEIQTEVKTQLINYFQEGRSSEDHANIFRDCLRQSIVNMEQLDLTLPQSIMQQALETIQSASRIWVTGEGMSRPLADLLAYGLRMFDYNVATLDTAAQHVAVELRNLTSTDLLIVVAVAHMCPDVTGIVELVRHRGAKTIALVGAESWPVSRASDIVLVSPSTSTLRFYSVTATASVIDGLLHMLYYTRRAQLTPSIAGFEEALHRLMSFRAQVEIAPLIPPEMSEAMSESIPAPADSMSPIS